MTQDRSINELFNEAIALNGAAREQYLCSLFDKYPEDIAIAVRQWIANIVTETASSSVTTEPSLGPTEDISAYLSFGTTVERVIPGGMAEIHVLNSGAALKTFKRHFVNDNKIRELFRQEAAIWSKLGFHPYILPLWGVGVTPRPWLLTQFEKDGSLESALADESVPVSWWRIVEICYAMEYAIREGLLCHGDIKPSNILLSHEEGGRAMLCDFGIARTIDMNFRVGLMGSPAYMAPELWRGRVGDQLSDIYSLGVVMWRLATRHIPISNPLGPEDVKAEGIPDPLIPIIRKCLETERSRRYESFTMLRKDLENAVSRLEPNNRSAPLSVTTFESLDRVEISGLRELFRLKTYPNPAAHDDLLALADRGLGRLASPGDWNTARMRRLIRPELLYHRMYALVGLQRFSEALDCAEEFSKTYPDDDRSQWIMAKSLIGLGDPVAALSYLEQLEAETGVPLDDPATEMLMVDALFMIGESERASNLLEHMADKRPNDIRSLAVRVHLLLSSGKDNEAEECSRLLVTADPQNPIFWGVRVSVLGALNRWDEVITAASQMSELDPTSPFPHLAMADAFERIGGHEQSAAEHLRRGRELEDASAKSPRNDTASDFLEAIRSARYQYALERYSEAESICRDVLEVAEPSVAIEQLDWVSVLDHLGDLWALTGEVSDAEWLYETALTVLENEGGLDHRFPSTCSKLTRLYPRSGETAKAKYMEVNSRLARYCHNGGLTASQLKPLLEKAFPDATFEDP